jgi:macrolide-specific efflux system membrane fusion protein
MKKTAYLALLLVLVAGGWRLRAISAGRAAGQVRVPTAEVTRGSLVVTLPVSGTLESAEETPVRAEIAGTLIAICQDNTPVKPADFAFQLDTKDLGDQRDELLRGLADAQDALNTTQADGETAIAQAESDATAARESLKLAQEKAQAENEKMAAQVKYAEGETARAERELVRTQRLAKLNYIAGTKLRDAEKSFRQQQFALEQQRAQQADTEKRTAEQVKDQETALALADHGLETAKADARAETEDARIRVAEAERRLADVDKKIGQCTVTAPAAGLAVIETNSENWPERRPYRLGDQVQSGASPVRIYNTSKMQVRCQIGEMDISRVHAGQEAFVTTPGQAGKRYGGRVALVEELAQEANVWQGGTPGKKVFGLLVTLGEADPVHMRPGMTVDLEIVLDSVREATMMPIRAVFTANGQSFVYRVREGGLPGQGFERVPVTIGTRNDLLVEVRSGVRAGDKVALESPPEPPVRHAEVTP